MPIYVQMESADVWGNPKNFCLDENFMPKEVAGCPPDAFSEDGQLWGNPIYDFAYMKKRGYDWWTARMAHMFKLCDVVRIDHFRAFDSYYCIPYGAKDAKNGVWRDGPGLQFFQQLEKKLGKMPVIAEDLGFLTERVRKLVDDTGFPGMKILQFAFNPWDNSVYLPHNFVRNCVVYPGTHDNNTIRGWYEQDASWEEKDYFRCYTGMPEGGDPVWTMIRAAFSSVADTVIVAMQDILGLGAEARMNVPSTVGTNWKWRALPGQIHDQAREKLKKYTYTFGRGRK